jgi:hypothetical protein
MTMNLMLAIMLAMLVMLMRNLKNQRVKSKYSRMVGIDENIIVFGIPFQKSSFVREKEMKRKKET